jgi:hypothetical protein
MMSRLALQIVFAGALLASLGATPVYGQVQATLVDAPTPKSDWPKPVNDTRVLNYITFD